VLTAINNRFVSTRICRRRARCESQRRRAEAVFSMLRAADELADHASVFDYKVSYRRALELQFRILARVLTGEIPEYVPF